MTSGACSFCSADATLVPTDQCRACRRCAGRVAELAKAGGVSGIWRSAKDADEVAFTIAERVAAQFSKADDEYHHHLAIALREMGMYSDARRAAGRALAAAKDDARATAALRLLVMPPLLVAGGLAKLRREMSGN